MKHFELEISRFVDNELPAEEQQKLFAHLSDCEECRKVLKDFMEMKKDTREFYENINVDINPEISLLEKTETVKKKNIFKPLFYFSAAASVVLGLLFFIKVSSLNKLESRYSSLELKYDGITAVYHSNQKKELKDEKEMNQIVLKENKVPPSKKENTPKQKENPALLAVNKADRKSPTENSKDNFFRPSNRTREIRVVQVTKDDFLTPQIVGN